MTVGQECAASVYAQVLKQGISQPTLVFMFIVNALYIGDRLDWVLF